MWWARDRVDLNHTERNRTECGYVGYACEADVTFSSFFFFLSLGGCWPIRRVAIPNCSVFFSFHGTGVVVSSCPTPLPHPLPKANSRGMGLVSGAMIAIAAACIVQSQRWKLPVRPCQMQHQFRSRDLHRRTRGCAGRPLCTYVQRQASRGGGAVSEIEHALEVSQRS